METIIMRDDEGRVWAFDPQDITATRVDKDGFIRVYTSFLPNGYITLPDPENVKNMADRIELAYDILVGNINSINIY